MKFTWRLLIVPAVILGLTTVSSYSETHSKYRYKSKKIQVKQTNEANVAMSLVQAIEAVRPAVFKINVQYQFPAADPAQPTVRTYSGTGFFVGKDGFAITALHVIHPSGIPAELGPAQIAGCVAMYTESRGVKSRASFLCVDIDLIDYDSSHDLALLRLRNKNEVPAPINASGNQIKPIFNAANMGTRAPKDGNRIAISGFPFNKPVLITNSGWLASSNGELFAAIPQPGMPDDSAGSENPELYLADMRVNQGIDGGPVYSVENGELVGVGTSFQNVPFEGTNESFIYKSGMSLIIPSKYIMRLIKKHKVNLR